MNIEIIYIPAPSTNTTPFQQNLTLPEGSSVEHAIEASTLFEQHSELTLTTLSIGIFGNRIELDEVLNDGDRIELYRPLTIDPMTARRLRAEKRVEQSKH